MGTKMYEECVKLFGWKLGLNQECMHMSYKSCLLEVLSYYNKGNTILYYMGVILINKI